MTSVGVPPQLERVSQDGLPQNENATVLPLIQELCNLLSYENVSYCHWKSNNALDRSANGDNDLDLLISRKDASRFSELLFKLGFKQAIAPAIKQMPGVVDYFGFEKKKNKFVHVHAHYQLVVGDDMTKNFRLPIEKPYLESATQDGLFMVPEVEFEFIVFVIRMVLKHSTWDAILSRQGTLKSKERQELAFLQSKINRNRVNAILNIHLPFISPQLFNDCIQSIEKSTLIRLRVSTAQQLQHQLEPSARRPLFDDVFLKLWRRVKLFFNRRILQSSLKYQLASGGSMIAILGGDGAGKTTVVDALSNWLSKEFETTQSHIGKPKRSWATIAVRGILKIGNLFRLYPQDSSFQKTLKQDSLISPGYPWLLREVCRARDRFRIFRKAQRFAVNGGLVILDRYPHPLVNIMDGPQTRRFINELEAGPFTEKPITPKKSNPISRLLVKKEESYYDKFVKPEIYLVLRLNPEIAVQRKTDEDPDSVRMRSKEMWEIEWDHSEVQIIDASKSKSEVLSEIRNIIWSQL